MESVEVSDTNFGLFIGYVLPGLTALHGIPAVTGTLSLSAPAPTVTEMLLVAVYSTAAGLTVSTVRWLVLDTLHHRTGIRPAAWDFARLDKNVAAFQFLIQIHYRYYKFYANMVVALVWAYATAGYALGWRGLGYWLLAGLFFLGSRDALRKYYDRVGRLLGSSR